MSEPAGLARQAAFSTSDARPQRRPTFNQNPVGTRAAVSILSYRSNEATRSMPAATWPPDETVRLQLKTLSGHSVPFAFATCISCHALVATR